MGELLNSVVGGAAAKMELADEWAKEKKAFANKQCRNNTNKKTFVGNLLSRIKKPTTKAWNSLCVCFVCGKPTVFELNFLAGRSSARTGFVAIVPLYCSRSCFSISGVEDESLNSTGFEIGHLRM